MNVWGRDEPLLREMIRDMNASLEGYIERDQRLGSDDPWEPLDGAVEDTHQVVVVDSIELDEHRVGTCGEVTFDDLGDLTHALSYLLVQRATFEADTDIRTGIIADLLGIDVVLQRGEHTILDHAHQTLIDGGARAILTFRYIT